MRILLIAIFLFATIHFIRIDFTEGTIPLAAFQENVPSIECTHKTEYIHVKTIAGDTIESLLALYPDPERPLIERLDDFYSLNPHLKQQPIHANAEILIPLSSSQDEKCESQQLK